jgi:hypothetical protein
MVRKNKIQKEKFLLVLLSFFQKPKNKFMVRKNKIQKEKFLLVLRSFFKNLKINLWCGKPKKKKKILQQNNSGKNIWFSVQL